MDFLDKQNEEGSSHSFGEVGSSSNQKHEAHDSEITNTLSQRLTQSLLAHERTISDSLTMILSTSDNHSHSEQWLAMDASESSTFAVLVNDSSSRNPCSQPDDEDVPSHDSRCHKTNSKEVQWNESRNEYYSATTLHAWDKHARWHDPSLYAANLQVFWNHVRHIWDTDEPQNPNSPINILDDCALACAFLQHPSELPEELEMALCELYRTTSTDDIDEQDKESPSVDVGLVMNIWGLEKFLQSQQPQPSTVQGYRRAILQAQHSPKDLRQLSEHTCKSRDRLLLAQLMAQAQARVVKDEEER